MSNQVVKFGFSAGVLSPRVLARTDLEKYDLGLALGRNFFIDTLGGASTRPGTEFVDYVQDMGEPVRITPFQFNEDVANSYLLVWTKNRLRFVQDGAYVLEAAVAISSTDSTTVTTSVDHGYAVGDWIKLGGRTYEVASVPTTTTFTITTPFGVAADPSVGSPTEVFRIYTVASPYATSDLAQLVLDQDLDVIYITHIDYKRYKLSRLGATNWTLAEVGYSHGTLSTNNVTSSATSSGSASAVYAIAPVDENGIESGLSRNGIHHANNGVDIRTTGGAWVIRWDTVPGAKYYKVYRTTINFAYEHATAAENFGFVGDATGRQFIDENFIGDFTQGPLTPTYPFDGGSISSITITAGGSGYAKNDTYVTVSGGSGTNFDAVAVVGDGTIYGVRILNPGIGYTSPTVTITGAGSGATTTATATPLTGNNPTCTATVQQRRVYAGTANFPSTVYASRVGEPDSFADSGFALANDPFTLTLASAKPTPIRFIKESPDGMFLFSADKVTQVRGENDNGLTADTARALMQTAKGCAPVDPLVIDREYIYVEQSYSEVIALRPSNLPTYYLTSNLSTLSDHFFTGTNPIQNWTWAKNPHNLIWATLADGTLLSCAFMPDQQIYAWTNHTTKGKAKGVVAVREGAEDKVYLLVERVVNGKTMKFVERMTSRYTETVDEMFAVDSGLTTTLTKPSASITVSAYSGTATVTASAGVFTSADVGKVLRVGGGRATVLTYSSATSITVSFDRAIPQKIPELSTPPTFASGEWSLDAKVSSVSGLWHLEGETVEVLGDGKVLSNATVSGGSITLSESASYVVAGLPYTAHLKTLPLAVADAPIEAERKRPAAVTVRLWNSREVLVGQDDKFYPLVDQRTTVYSAGTGFQNGLVSKNITAAFDHEGAIEFKKSGPLHTTILGYVAEYEVGST